MQLHKYQVKAKNFIINKKRVCLFLDMGLGKTAITLHAISELIASGEVKKVLIIAPVRVCNMVWRQELEKWNINNIKISLCTGSRKQRLKGLNNREANVYLINRENTVSLCDSCKYAINRLFDMLVIDEASSYKNPKSKRFQAIRYLNFKYTVMLTGSPSPNGLKDLWAVTFLADKGKALGRSLGNFTQRFLTNPNPMQPYNYIPQVDALTRISEALKPFCLSMKSKDYLELPPFILNNIELELPHKLQKQYEELDKYFVLYDDEDLLVAVRHQLPLITKLLQFCNGFVYKTKEEDEDEEEDEPLFNPLTPLLPKPKAVKEVAYLHDLKIEALKDILEDNPNKSYIVAYIYEEDKKMLLKHIAGSKTLSKSGVEADEWLRGEFRVLLLQPQSSAYGLNLQSGGCDIIWYSITYNAEQYTQLNKRLHRQGQPKPVTVTHLSIAGGLDSKVVKVLANKLELENQVMDSLK